MLNRSESGSTSVCLVVVFNHRFEANLQKLQALYGSRFRNIRYIMPFYRGNRKDVIPVYESAYRFQGFFAQSYAALEEGGFTHYVVVGDDLILNPRLNEDNLLSELSLGSSDAYTKVLVSLTNTPFEWWVISAGLRAWREAESSPWVEFRAEIPSLEEAARRFAAHGMPVGNPSWSSLRGYNGGFGYSKRLLLSGMRTLLRGRRQKSSPYPLAAGYSDFMVIPSQFLQEFSHLCGVFAAMNLSGEVGTPTALALSCPNVVQETPAGWQGIELWGDERDAWVRKQKSMTFQEVLATFKERQLYIHPVKLSQFSDVALQREFAAE